MSTNNPAHLKASDYLGLHRYSLIFCTDRRRHLFVRPDVVMLVLSQISRSAADEHFAIVAYCFMPDGLHLLVEAQSDSSNARRFIARAKQYSGFHYSRTFRRALWQRYGFERVLRDDEGTLVVARYILESPVRAGLVRAPEEYPFLGSKVYPLNHLLAGSTRSGRG